jgi:hypothetical protein
MADAAHDARRKQGEAWVGLAGIAGLGGARRIIRRNPRTALMTIPFLACMASVAAGIAGTSMAGVAAVGVAGALAPNRAIENRPLRCASGSIPRSPRKAIVTTPQRLSLGRCSIFLSWCRDVVGAQAETGS